MNLVDYIWRQYTWSINTFGDGDRTESTLKHIEKEIIEVQKSRGKDPEEWIDIIILAIEGLWRSGCPIQKIPEVLETKLAKNIARRWPKIEDQIPGEPVEHIRDEDT